MIKCAMIDYNDVSLIFSHCEPSNYYINIMRVSTYQLMEHTAGNLYDNVMAVQNNSNSIVSTLNWAQLVLRIDSVPVYFCR